MRHNPVTTGCQVWCQVKPLVGTAEAGVPMLAPKVKWRSKPRKKFTYHSSPLASASCVNTGSESTNTLRGIAAYSSRQNQDPPERLMNRSASAHQPRTCSCEAP